MIQPHSDPAMTYERIVRQAFSCGKHQDPLGLAKQETYNHNFDPIDFRLKIGLSYALFKLGKDLDVETLEDLSENVWECTEQERIMEIMDQAIGLVNQAQE